jgi:hypothetical protein
MCQADAPETGKNGVFDLSLLTIRHKVPTRGGLGMLKAILVAFAALSLTACASLPGGVSMGSVASFDAVDAAPIEQPVALWSARSDSLDAFQLNRRAFGASPWRRPDGQALYVTAADRRFRRQKRRRRAHREPQRR